VGLIISKGVPIVVPNIIDQSYSQAQQTLSSMGLSISISTTQPTVPESNPEFSDLIVQQSPLAGQKLQAGNSVTVSIGQYVAGTTGAGPTTTTTTTTTTTFPFSTTTAATTPSFPSP
jgi:beta-lactam-binding protein with PASTA domain